ncbi:Spherulation-specific family 4-domain-containing protein [Mycena amicta]|nr:Spherulation-specific family 4-domain-containing protein [Mycena amicta]
MLPHGLVILLIHLFWVPSVTALGVLLPLYVYPNNNCAAWSSVNSAISAHSSTQWYIIINPQSGPGKTDTLYQHCVASLASATNRITMGYIDTNGGNVESDIDTYAAWPSNARPTGIYFDPINPTSDNLNTYSGYVSYAKSKGFSFIGLDPGQTVSDSYLALGDLVNTYESSYSAFQASSLTGTLSKQSVNLENAPSSGSYSAVINQLESMGVAAVYITNEDDSSSAVPAQLSSFVSSVASAGGSSGSSSSGSPSSDPPPASNPASPSGTATSSGANPNSSATHATSKTIAGNLATGSSAANAPGETPGSSSSGSGSGSNSNGSGSDGLGATQHHGPSIPAIVGGILGALVVLLGVVIVTMCLRRRKRRLGTGSLESGIAPFTQVRRPGLPASMAIDTNTIASFSNEDHHVQSPESTIGGSLPPSRAWQTQAWAADVKAPLPESDEDGSATAALASSSHASWPSPPAPGPSIPLPSSSLDPNPFDAARTHQRASFLSAFSTYTSGSGSTVPAYPGAQHDSLPPPAYA